jgi:hypothetical protein
MTQYRLERMENERWVALAYFDKEKEAVNECERMIKSAGIDSSNIPKYRVKWIYK